MKIKINASAIYMATYEVREALTGKDLNKKDEITEKIYALDEIQGKEIHIHGYDRDNESVTLSRHEKSKRYSYPMCVLDDGEEEKEEEEKEEKEEEEKKDYMKRVKLSVIGVAISLISIGSTIIFKNFPPDAQASGITKIQAQKNEQNANNLIIGSEYEKQKNLRDEIKKSIEKVKELEQKNKNIEREILSSIQ